MNDKLFHKQKAKQAREIARKKATREIRKRVLIVCEDSKSVPSYIQCLKKEFNLKAAIEIKHFGSNPKSVVDHGINSLNKDGDYDYAFFVFDKDEHHEYDNPISKIKTEAKKRIKNKCKIYPITSVPCFEIWLKLHFSKSTKPYQRKGKKSPAGELISDLKKINAFKNYSKDNNCSYFDAIKKNLEVAIKNAKYLEQNSTEKNLHYKNPSTNFYKLVEIFKEIKKEQD